METSTAESEIFQFLLSTAEFLREMELFFLQFSCRARQTTNLALTTETRTSSQEVDGNSLPFLVISGSADA